MIPRPRKVQSNRQEFILKHVLEKIGRVSTSNWYAENLPKTTRRMQLVEIKRQKTGRKINLSKISSSNNN